jgi:hypothetical protein
VGNLVMDTVLAVALLLIQQARQQLNLVVMVRVD